MGEESTGETIESQDRQGSEAGEPRDPATESAGETSTPSSSTYPAPSEDAAQSTASAPSQGAKKPRTLLVAIITGVVALAIGVVIGLFAGNVAEDGAGGAFLSDGADEVVEEETCEWLVYDSDEGEDASAAETVLSDLVGKLPIPQWGDVAEDESSVVLEGYLWTDSTDRVSLDLYGVKKADYTEYLAACIDAGFDNGFYKGDSSFSASDDDGLELTLYWFSDKELDLSLDAPEGYGEEGADTGSDEELNELLDDCEDFVDDYVEFMEDYSDADASEQAEMISDYADMVSEYAEFAEELEAYDTDDMSSDDLERYLEVTESIAEATSDL